MILGLDEKYTRLNYSLQLLLGALGMVIYVILGKRYELSQLAEFFKTVAYISVVQVIVDYGFDLGNLRDMSISKAKKIKLLISTSAVKIVCGGVIIFVSFVLSYFTDLTFHPVLLVTGALLSTFNLSWFFFLTKNSFVFSIFSLIFKTFSLIILLLFTGDDFNINVVLLLLYAPVVLPGMFVIFYYFYRNNEPFDLTSLGGDFFISLKGNAYIFLNNLVAATISISWPLTLSWFLIPELVSVYGFIDKLNKGLLLVFRPLPFFLLTSSKSVKLIIIEGFERSKGRVWLFICLLSAVIISLYNLELVLDMVFPDKFEGYITYFYVYLLQIPVLLLLMVVYTWMIQNGRAHTYTWASLVTVVIVFVLAKVMMVNIFFPLIFECIVLCVISLFLVVKSVFYRHRIKCRVVK